MERHTPINEESLLGENQRLKASNAQLLEALEQVAVLAEYNTTGPGKCKSEPLTAEQATSLRKAISDISRAAIRAARGKK